MSVNTYGRNLLAGLAATYILGCLIGVFIHLIHLTLQS